MAKIIIKNDIVNWLAAQDTFIGITDVMAHKVFEKDTKLKCELRLFKTYFKQFQQGIVAPKVDGGAVVSADEINAISLNVFNAGKDKLQAGIFTPYTTGTGVDRLFSSTNKGGGPMKGTVTVATGGAGVGKSTVIYAMQAKLQENYPKDEIVCLNSEMKRLDLEWELSKENPQAKPWMATPNFLLLNEICRKDGGTFRPEYVKPVVEKVFQHGYDVIFMDSFEDLVGKLNAYSGMTEKQAESFLLNLIEATCDAKNDRGVHTAVVAIQQETKGGVFKGSNKLKHAITGMLHMRKDKRGDRYIVFSKNRRNGGDVDKALYFGLNKQGELVYDLKQFEEAEDLAQSLKGEKERMAQKVDNFKSIFAQSTMDEKLEKAGKVDDKKLKGKGKKVVVPADADDNEEE